MSGVKEEEEVLVEIERRNAERDRRERLFWTYEAALVAIAQGHEKPVELAVKTLLGG
jgi:hypothetical protein